MSGNSPVVLRSAMQISKNSTGLQSLKAGEAEDPELLGRIYLNA
jgi:hypothetical protein